MFLIKLLGGEIDDFNDEETITYHIDKLEKELDEQLER